MTQPLLIASQNPHKIAELQPLLEQAGFAVTDARSHALPEPVEDSGSFIGNARIKAKAAVEATGMAVLADDSGLIVDALGDFPGVETEPVARSLGGYANGVADMVQRLDGRPADCHYFCVLLLLFPDGREIVATGRTDGVLLSEKQGESAFGYDPWFLSKETGRSFAQMSAEEKKGLTHRSRALQDLMQKLEGRHDLRAVS